MVLPTGDICCPLVIGPVKVFKLYILYPLSSVYLHCCPTLFLVVLQEVYHSRRQIKYSKDKMWYLAKMVSRTAAVTLCLLGVVPLSR